MKKTRWMWIAVVLCLVASGVTAYSVSKPATASSSPPPAPPPPPDTADTAGAAALPEEAASATADPLATDLTVTSTDGAEADGAGSEPGAVTDSALPQPDPNAESFDDLSRLHMGWPLETEAWLLPLLVFVVATLLGLVAHGILVAHDVKKWPDSNGSWWKLRFGPMLLGVAALVATYFFFIHGLDEEALRIAGPRVRLWLYIYGILTLALWLLPKPKFARRATPATA